MEGVDVSSSRGFDVTMFRFSGSEVDTNLISQNDFPEISNFSFKWSTLKHVAANSKERKPYRRTLRLHDWFILKHYSI